MMSPIRLASKSGQDFSSLKLRICGTGISEAEAPLHKQDVLLSAG